MVSRYCPFSEFTFQDLLQALYDTLARSNESDLVPLSQEERFASSAPNYELSASLWPKLNGPNALSSKVRPTNLPSVLLTMQVSELISEATLPSNLYKMYEGWASWI